MYDIALFGFHILDTIPMARQTAIEQLQAGMLVLDPQGKIGSSKPAAQSILGSPTKRLQGWSKFQLLRIVQEALTNVRNTPAPSMWRLPSSLENGCIRVTVQDDGQGFENTPGALSNSSSDPGSLIATNTTITSGTGIRPNRIPERSGLERIDIDPNGGTARKSGSTPSSRQPLPRDCHEDRVDLHGLREYDAWKNVYVYYWAALDFRTGETVWKKMAGTGERFDSFYPGLAIGPNGALYAGVYGGIIEIKDTR